MRRADVKIKQRHPCKLKNENGTVIDARSYEVLLLVYPIQTFPDSPGEKHRQKIAEILRLVVSYMRHTMHH
jgi:hypothetical protein